MSSNPLTDVLPDRIRRVAYAVLFVLALVFSAWQASSGDWVVFAGGIITALFGATAASNVSGAPKASGPASDGGDTPNAAARADKAAPATVARRAAGSEADAVLVDRLTDYVSTGHVAGLKAAARGWIESRKDT